MSSKPTGWRRLLWPLASRKVQTAVVTVLAAWAAEANLNVSPGKLAAIIAVGVSIILGIAHEDHGEKSAH